MEKYIVDLYSIYRKSPIVVTDSRQITDGCIFFALKGESFDGNTYARQAIEKGAAYAVIDNPSFEFGERTILVNDTLEALQQLANYHRRQLNIPFIGITGTNGKTTTKELIYTVLHKRYKTIATKGNLNNHIGVPLTLLAIPLDTEIAIIEMGANHPKEIEFLCKIAEPDFGLITNIGKAHLEGFGGYQGVINTKKELYTYIHQLGKLVFVNSDNELLMELSDNINRITYTTKSNTDTTIVSNQPFLAISHNNHLYQTHLAGTYNFDNIMAAVSIARYFKIDDNTIFEAIVNYIPENNRSQIKETSSNTVIMDAYNANPSSMKAALENFENINHPNKLAILGDMFELGDESHTEHAQIIQLISAQTHFSSIVVGAEFAKIAQNHQNILSFESVMDLKKHLSENPVKGKMILLKGSRGMKMEQLIDVL